MMRSHIPYDVLVQNALRGVVHHVLEDVAKNGLPGDHHFFITFSTHMDGVDISPRLKERYPDKMTIVLQHQFWDLTIEDEYLSVMLSFGDVAEKLVIPFVAVQAFYDPVAAFEAAFDIASNHEPRAQDGLTPNMALSPVQGDESGNITVLSKNALRDKTTPPLSSSPLSPELDFKNKAAQADQIQQKQDATKEDKVKKDEPGGDVISLDAFRKK